MDCCPFIITREFPVRPMQKTLGKMKTGSGVNEAVKVAKFVRMLVSGQ